MRIPLTKYGWPEVIVFPATIIVAMAACLLVFTPLLPGWATVSIVLVLGIVLIWVLMFFRDPERSCPSDKNLLLSPADGKVTDIEVVKEDNHIGADSLRIGIFLSIFDVHINRSPCNAKIEKITHKRGVYKNAANPHSGRVNESKDLYLVRADSPEDKLIVRQISGAIARRIVCEKAEGQKLSGGEKFGMIKFGSRTELYAPAGAGLKCLVKTGDKVKAGLTALLRYE